MVINMQNCNILIRFCGVVLAHGAKEKSMVMITSTFKIKNGY